ncbi:hypothetical protein Ciccas_004161 [Cichlidogyrus casuarinus]|uniref:Uncharacterized protein n=1 Tax=Cichlidogyrus casuarinus TaxID=1844966 RepID=A0ABD2QC93_9PLAT
MIVMSNQDVSNLIQQLATLYKANVVNSLQKIHFLDDIRITADEKYKLKSMASAAETAEIEAVIFVEFGDLCNVPTFDEILKYLFPPDRLPDSEIHSSNNKKNPHETTDKNPSKGGRSKKINIEDLVTFSEDTQIIAEVELSIKSIIENGFVEMNLELEQKPPLKSTFTTPVLSKETTRLSAKSGNICAELIATYLDQKKPKSKIGSAASNEVHIKLAHERVLPKLQVAIKLGLISHTNLAELEAFQLPEDTITM